MGKEMVRGNGEGEGRGEMGHGEAKEGLYVEMLAGGVGERKLRGYA